MTTDAVDAAQLSQLQIAYKNNLILKHNNVKG